MMSEQRMSAQERRAAIVKAVLPLFAKRGFANATTKDLAEAAGVSEALIYKHFPSKEMLYAEIQNFGCDGDHFAQEKLDELEPSTSALIHIVYYLMRCVLIGSSSDPVGWEVRHRLVLHSCLEDGSYPRYLFNHHFKCCYRKIEACLNAAGAAGDLVESPVKHRNRILFALHVACMTAVMQLPKEPIVDYQANRFDLLNEAVWFALRGLGLSDKALASCYDPKGLAGFFDSTKP